ncbi:MAG: 3-phosphoserine/phosphohydroxythreonine transaminase, partial [Planctomycetaceae bacterium]
HRVFNFSAGPAVLPLPVLEQAREDLLSLNETGIGVLEHSHRGPAFQEALQRTKDGVRRLAAIPDDYEVLFLQGGASSQFFMVPMNLLKTEQTAEYLITGSWSKKAMKEAAHFGKTRVACSSAEQNFNHIPPSCDFGPTSRYVHFTSNNTIYGTQFANTPQIPDDRFLVCDASSDIFSRPMDFSRYGLVYAGAQKNLGPSGVTLVVIRKDLVEQAESNLPTMLQYRTFAENDSLYNTPPTFGIYLMGLVLEWITELGGLAAMARHNESKANILYDHLDRSELFRGTAETSSRSLMNVTFVTGDADLDARFLKIAEQAGLLGLKGHRSVGGMRASLYNAFPTEGVQRLVELMVRFEREGR